MVNPRDFCRVGLLDRPWPGLVTGAAHNALAGPRIRQRSTSTYAWLPATLPPGSSSSCPIRSEEHTSELQSHLNLVCRLLLEKKNSPLQQQHLDIRRSQYLTRMHLACG